MTRHVDAYLAAAEYNRLTPSEYAANTGVSVDALMPDLLLAAHHGQVVPVPAPTGGTAYIEVD